VKITGEAQTFDGFGTCFNELGEVALQNLPDNDRKNVMDLIFDPNADGLRLDVGRMPIGASDYAAKWYSHNEVEGDFEMKHFSIERDNKYLLPYIKDALKRNPNLYFCASPWSPPTWMKFPQAHNFGTMVWTEENLKAYALYFVKFVQAYKAMGIEISQIHVQNEPHSSQKFPSCVWTGEEMTEFIGKYLGPAFEAAGIDAEIWFGTINGPEVDGRWPITRFNQYANLALHDELATKYIKGVSYQWAGKYAIASTKQSFPDIKLMQSENECGDGENTWVYAKYVDELFHHYLYNGASYYVYWNAVLAPKGGSTWGWTQNSMINVDNGKAIFNHEYYVMKHYSRFVQKGAKVLTLEGKSATNTTAFKNPDGTVIVVVTNPFNRDMDININLGDGKEINAKLPKDSLNTFVV